MGYDDILIQIGELGPYQWRIVFFVCVSTLVCPWHLLIQVFFILDTPHWCSVKSWDRQNCSEWNISSTQCEEIKKNLSIPFDEEYGYSKCQKYNVSFLEFQPDINVDSLDKIDCDEGWTYDESENGPSIISKFDLVCDREGLPQIAQSLFFMGSLFGSVVYGMIADWIGRFHAWWICLLHQFVCGIIVIYMPNFWSYTLVRVILAPANYAAWIIPVIMATEYVGPNKRMVSGLFIEYFFATGFMIMTILAWLIRDWAMLQLTVTLMQCYILLYLFCVPESPRWLVAENRIPEAAKIIRRIAKGNGTQLPPNFEEELQDEYRNKIKVNEEIRFVDIFTNRTMLFRTMNMSFAWFAHGLTYFGLTLGASSLGIDVYVSFFVSAFIEIPSYTAAMICLFKFGRKNTTAFFMIVGGIICMLVVFAPLGPWRATAAYIGKLAVTTSFVILFVYGAEIFPTPVRGFGVGFCSIMGRIGDILSPVINLLRSIWLPFPLLLYGVVIIISGIWVLTSLPETRKKDLPETMEDAVNLGRKRQKIPAHDDQFNENEKL